MKKILSVTSSPVGNQSFSNQLAKAVVSQLQKVHPDAKLEEINLARTHYPHLEESHLNSWFVDPNDHSPEQRAALLHSDESIQKLMDADIIVIGTPMYNFGIPSNLKAWIDHVIRAGKTFVFQEDGTPKGLVNGKKVYIAISSGSIYSEGPSKVHDFVEPYLRTILGFIGITDVSVFRAEGTAIPGLREVALQKAVDTIRVN